MRQVSKSELKRLRKSGTVRKKMGEQPAKERPGPVADGDKGMSGSVTPEQPAPVLAELGRTSTDNDHGHGILPNGRTTVDMDHDHELLPGGRTSVNNDHDHSWKETKPHAAMAISNQARDGAFEDLIAMNKKVIEDFTAELTEQRANVRKRVPWDHDLIRDDKTGLLKKIRSTPLES